MLRRACAAGQGTMACAAWTGLRQRLVRSGRCAGPPTGRVTGCPGCCPGCCCRACLRARPPAAGDQRDALHGLDAPRLPVQQRGHDGGAHLPATGCKSGRAGSAGQGSRPAAWQRSMGGACGAGSSAAPAPQIAQGAPGAPIPASRASSRVLLMRTSWYARFSLTPKESGRLGRRMPCARGGAARARGALGPPPGPLPPASTRRTPALAATAYACAPARLAALGCACVTARNLLDSWPPPPPGRTCRTRSTALYTSACVTSAASRRTASSAASFSTFPSSAPAGTQAVPGWGVDSMWRSLGSGGGPLPLQRSGWGVTALQGGEAESIAEDRVPGRAAGRVSSPGPHPTGPAGPWPAAPGRRRAPGGACARGSAWAEVVACWGGPRSVAA